MNDFDFSMPRSRDAAHAQATNKVLRNTYLLLSMTLLFSACTAGAAMMAGLSLRAGFWLMIGSFFLMFWVQKAANTSQGLLAVFVYTGVMGAALGPIVGAYLTLANGSAIVMEALGGTALIFLSLSGYALVSRKDFSFIGGFLTTGLIVVIVAMLVNIFLRIPALDLALAAVVILIMSGYILFEPSRIIHGGETNYIRATVSLYLSIVNIFLSLLRILGGTRN